MHCLEEPSETETARERSTGASSWHLRRSIGDSFEDSLANRARRKLLQSNGERMCRPDKRRRVPSHGLRELFLCLGVTGVFEGGLEVLETTWKVDTFLQVSFLENGTFTE